MTGSIDRFLVLSLSPPSPRFFLGGSREWLSIHRVLTDVVNINTPQFYVTHKMEYSFNVLCVTIELTDRPSTPVISLLLVLTVSYFLNKALVIKKKKTFQVKTRNPHMCTPLGINHCGSFSCDHNDNYYLVTDGTNKILSRCRQSRWNTGFAEFCFPSRFS